MGDALGLQPLKVEVNEGALFVALHTAGQEEAAVIAQSARPLHRGLARLAIDPEIIAFVIPTSQISPKRPLAESFLYLTEDISLEMRDELDALNLLPSNEPDTFLLEIEHLVNL